MKGKRQLIITYPEDMDVLDAVGGVRKILEMGKVSQLRRKGITVLHYCWVTMLDIGRYTQKGTHWVYVREKQSDASADSFVIQPRENA